MTDDDIIDAEWTPLDVAPVTNTTVAPPPPEPPPFDPKMLRLISRDEKFVLVAQWLGEDGEVKTATMRDAISSSSQRSRRGRRRRWSGTTTGAGAGSTASGR